jgi:hypothetical protein
MRLLACPVNFPGTTIPVAAVVRIPFNLVQDRMDPRSGRVILILLDDIMGGIPLAGQRQFNGFKQIVFHDSSFTSLHCDWQIC